MATKTKGKNQRITFGHHKEAVEIPNLIQIQLDSYRDFLQLDKDPKQRTSDGLHGVFQEVFPIQSYDNKVKLEYVKYDIEDPKISVAQCMREGQT